MMARRAATKAEADMAAEWRGTYPSLSELTKQSDASETVKKANNYLEKFLTELSTPDQTAAELKPTKILLRQTLDDIKKKSEKEVETCDKALIEIETLIKAASERPKRLRESSAAPSQLGSTTATAATSAASGTSSSVNGVLRVVIPPRASQIMERTKKQLPLTPGRKVAFRVPDKAGYEEGGWILATIKEEKNHRYIVQDVESEDGQEPPEFEATLDSLMPLPLVDVPEKDPKHLNEYPEYPAGRAVLALFPDTTSFYKAEVVATPKDLRAEGQRTAPAATRAVPSYKVKFEDDQDQTRLVSAEYVIEFPEF